MSFPLVWSSFSNRSSFRDRAVTIGIYTVVSSAHSWNRVRTYSNRLCKGSDLNQSKLTCGNDFAGRLCGLFQTREASRSWQTLALLEGLIRHEIYYLIKGPPGCEERV
jgi:hypothetical protein